jgi:hypothetical protein
MIDKALANLRPNSAWVVAGDTYADIQWLDKLKTQPTEEEIAAECVRLQAEYDAKQYQRDRTEEYPSLPEQLDMQYWDSVNGTTVWQDTINAIKTKYPKPTES